MHRTGTPQRTYLRRGPDADDPRFPILIFMTTVMLTLAALALAVPWSVVLPAFSLCALAAAAGVALTASMRARLGRTSSVSAWNLFGACMLAGWPAATYGQVVLMGDDTSKVQRGRVVDD